MKIDSKTLGHSIIKINLSGRMDILGVQAIDMKFTALTAAPKAPVLVDMSEVSFLASLGVRTLLSSAKDLSKRGGHMVLYKPQPTVLDVLKSMGVSSLIPVYDDLDAAMNALVAHQDG